MYFGITCYTGHTFNSFKAKNPSHPTSLKWHGRSKRASFSLSKKMMMSEPDLRQRDTGNWHDEL